MRINCPDTARPAFLRQQALMDGQIRFSAHMNSALQQHIQCAPDGALAGILDRHDAIIRLARLYRTEHVVDGCAWPALYRTAETFQSSCLGERPFLSEIGNRQ